MTHQPIIQSMAILLATAVALLTFWLKFWIDNRINLIATLARLRFLLIHFETNLYKSAGIKTDLSTMPEFKEFLDLSRSIGYSNTLLTILIEYWEMRNEYFMHSIANIPFTDARREMFRSRINEIVAIIDSELGDLRGHPILRKIF